MLELSGWSGHFENVIAFFKEFSQKKKTFNPMHIRI